MLTMVTATNDAYGDLLLPLFDASNGYSVKDVEGIGPVKATLTSTSLAQLDGGKLNNARREQRNITMKLGLETDWVTNSVSGLRRQLYQWFSPKANVTFGLYEDDQLFGTAQAVVESCEPNMFSADPEVDISLICEDPDFYGDTIPVAGMTTSSETTQEIIYDGSSDAGIVFSMTFVENATSVYMYNTRPDKQIQVLNLEGSFTAGDILTINSVPGQKAAVVTTAGLPKSVLSYLHTRSDWITLQPGSNLFRVYYVGTSTPFTLEYTNAYGGF